MAKNSSGVQIEMLLPIAGKRSISSSALKPTKAKPLTYEKIVASLRAKGLTRSAVKK